MILDCMTSRMRGGGQDKQQQVWEPRGRNGRCIFICYEDVSYIE